MSKRAGLYTRVSTVDQHPENQLIDLRQMTSQRELEVVKEYTDRISGAKAKRPGHAPQRLLIPALRPVHLASVDADEFSGSHHSRFETMH